MIIEKISALKIHKLTQEQYERELEDGNIDETALYLTEEVDYPVEVGTSGIWTYRKMASGIAECWGNYNITTTCNTSWAGTNMFESPSIALPNFPFTFSGTPVPSLTWFSIGKGAIFQYVMNITETNAGNTMLLRPEKVDSITGYVSMHYIGKWK